MHKCEHNENNTTDPWKHLLETQPPSLIINKDKVSMNHWPPAIAELFIFHLYGWPQSLCFSSKSHNQSTLALWEGQFSEAAWHVESRSVQHSGRSERKEEKGRHILQCCVPAAWVKIISLYYCSLKIKVRIDIGGNLSETMKEKLLDIKLGLKIVKIGSDYVISYYDYNKTKFM